MSDVVKVLRDARALVASGWTQGELARDALQRPAATVAPGAVCWCSIGALLRITADAPAAVFMEAAEALRDAVGPRVISEWNDTLGRTQAEVLAAFDRAIALAESPTNG